MRRKFSLGRFLHNDRLILVVSFVLAIAVWAVVVYGPSNEQERTISGVPVAVSLGEYADTMNIHLLDGQDFVASVKVYGRRSVISQLTAQDILLTVDTTDMVKPGTYSGLSIKATKNGKQTDFEIVSVEPAMATLTCDVWVESTFVVQTKMPGITSADETKYQLGTPLVSGDAMQNSTVSVTGPKSEIDLIKSIVAEIEDTEVLSATQVFDAKLKAVDANGNEVSIPHCVLNSDNTSVRVTVPVLFYHRLDLKAQLLNLPDAYKGRDDIVVFDPPYLELWGNEQAIEEFEKKVNEQCTFDFNNLSGDKMAQQFSLEPPAGLKVLDGVDEVNVKFNLGVIRSQSLNVPLSEENVQYENLPEGLEVKLVEAVLNVDICRPAGKVVNTSELKIVLDMNNEATIGQRVVPARVLVLNRNNVWVYYGEDTASYELLVTVAKKDIS